MRDNIYFIQRGIQMKNYSIKDIAKLSGVSIATVSRVINNNGRFSEETRQRVLKVIEETDYKMNYIAKNLRMNRSFTIGILVPNITNDFFSAIVQKIEELLFDEGYSTIICTTDQNLEKEMASLKRLREKGIDGLIVLSGTDPFEFRSSSSEKQIPYICIDREPKNKETTILISSNHYQGAFEASEELINAGCRHPIIVMQYQLSTPSTERLRGFKAALTKHGFSFETTRNLLCVDSNVRSITEKLSEFLASNPDADGIFSINDSIALKLLDSLKRLKLQVPNDFKVIGYDDIFAAKYTSPSLSSVHQDTEKIAQKSIMNLLKLIENPQKTGKILTLPVNLVSRESTKSVL